jgi:hypothetical protein
MRCDVVALRQLHTHRSVCVFVIDKCVEDANLQRGGVANRLREQCSAVEAQQRLTASDADNLCIYGTFAALAS